MKFQRLAALVVVSASLLASSCRRDGSFLAGYVDKLPSYDLSGLNEGQREEFFKVINAEPCPCGLPLRLGDCITRGKACPAAHSAARFAVRRVRAGDSLSRVVLMLDRMFQGTTKPEVIDNAGIPAKGPADAPVTLTLFSDFQCPFCKRAKPELDKLLAAFPTKVRLVFRHMPLPLHKQAMGAALAAEAAHRQGKFWAMHDELFKNNLNLDKDILPEYGKRVGLDVERFKKDVASAEVKARVEADMALAKKLGIAGTPSLYINGRPMNGAHRFDNYRDYVEVALDLLPGGRPAGGR